MNRRFRFRDRDSLSLSDLQTEHGAEAIRRRLEHRPGGHLSNVVLGGIDGAVTTFAIVAGAMGGGLSSLVIIILGFANVLADGFSMAVSSYNACKTQAEQIARARRIENEHIDRIPEGEQEEVRQILARKGLRGLELENAVQSITSDRRLWVDTMLAEEWGLLVDEPAPFQTALTTFASFIAFGTLPLIPFLIPGQEMPSMFGASIVLTGAAFTGVGVLKGVVLGGPPLRSGVETLLGGAAAATLAYLAGMVLRLWLGAGS